MSHTPGPWHVNSSGLQITEGTGVCIAEAFSRGTETPSPEANAKLIAAAPDMLEALMAAETLIFAISIAVGSRDYFKLRGILRDAINKAKGK